jgi:hypothetical protein
MKKVSLTYNLSGFTMIKREKFLIITSKIYKKIQNLRNKPILYFSIDDGNFPLAKMITENSKKRENVIIEISPKFFSTWDFGKEQL